MTKIKLPPPEDGMAFQLGSTPEEPKNDIASGIRKAIKEFKRQFKSAGHEMDEKLFEGFAEDCAEEFAKRANEKKGMGAIRNRNRVGQGPSF